MCLFTEKFPFLCKMIRYFVTALEQPFISQYKESKALYKNCGSFLEMHSKTEIIPADTFFKRFFK